MTKGERTKNRILRFVIAFTEENGYPPSLREICEAVGLRSTSTAHIHLNALREQGLIRKDGRKTRSLTTSYSGGVPILGSVTAGEPIYAFEEDCGRLPYRVEGAGEHFALAVRGDSMVNAGILDGDFVVVRRQQAADNNDIVVALLEDEATVKRLLRKKGQVWLMPENPNYAPIDGSHCSILGLVVAVVREM